MQKGFIVPALIIAVSLVLIAGGLLGAFYFGKKSSGPPSTNPTVQQEASDETVYTDEGSANWKTYSNKEYNFSLKHPADLTINDTAEYSIVTFRKDGEIEGDCIAIWLNIHSIESNNIKKWIAENRKRIMPDNQIIVPEINPYTNGNITGYWIETGSESIGKSIFVQKGTKYLEISTPGCVAGDHYEYHDNTLKIMDQMISTFKFTN